MATRKAWPLPDGLPDLGVLGYAAAPPGSDPPGAYLAPERDEELPAGLDRGEMDVAELPRGPAAVVAGAAPEWAVRALRGAGWVHRNGKGATRGDASRPVLKILEPCSSVTLRAVGIDPEWLDVLHHVVIGWVYVVRTGKSSPEHAWLWSSEPAPTASAGAPDRQPVRRIYRRNPRRVSLAEATAVLARAPSDASMDLAFEPGDAAFAAGDVLLFDGSRIRGA